MSRNRRTVEATFQQVWEMLSDGWLYPLWVVGATRMREVDDSWPAVGSRLHHSVGSWPVMLDDVTEVVAVDPPTRLVLRARARPFGTAEVTLDVTAAGRRTHIQIRERIVSGPGAVVPGPAQDLMLKWRNQETLHRLAYLVEHRPGHARSTDGRVGLPQQTRLQERDPLPLPARRSTRLRRRRSTSLD